MKTNRPIIRPVIRKVHYCLYSKSNGLECYAGPPENAQALERSARQAVAAYLAAGIPARFVGAV